MIIGFIGFGRVSENLVKLIKSNDIEFITSTENRTKKTIKCIHKSNIKVFDSYKEVARKSDILISATSPKSALNNAKSYAKYLNGIYLDLNNISPNTAYEINKSVCDFVKGAIIGKIDSNNPIIYVSGENADKLLFLNDFLNIKKISDDVGDAAILKLLRSTYTKSLSAILIESSQIAEKYSLTEEFFEILSLTEGVDFKDKSLSRIRNTFDNPQRKSEELSEILEYFEDDLLMVKAALNKFNQL